MLQRKRHLLFLRRRGDGDILCSADHSRPRVGPGHGEVVSAAGYLAVEEYEVVRARSELNVIVGMYCDKSSARNGAGHFALKGFCRCVVGHHRVGVVGQGARGCRLFLFRVVALQGAHGQDAVAQVYGLLFELFFFVGFSRTGYAYFLFGVIVGKVYRKVYGLGHVYLALLVFVGCVVVAAACRQ